MRQNKPISWFVIFIMILIAIIFVSWAEDWLHWQQLRNILAILNPMQPVDINDAQQNAENMHRTINQNVPNDERLQQLNDKVLKAFQTNQENK